MSWQILETDWTQVSCVYLGLTHCFLKSPDKGDLGGVFAGVFLKNIESTAFWHPNAQYVLRFASVLLEKIYTQCGYWIQKSMRRLPLFQFSVLQSCDTMSGLNTFHKGEFR